MANPEKDNEKMLPYLDKFLEEMLPKNNNHDFTIEMQNEANKINNEFLNMNKNDINGNKLLYQNNYALSSPGSGSISTPNSPQSPLSHPSTHIDNEIKLIHIPIMNSDYAKMNSDYAKQNSINFDELKSQPQDWALNQQYEKEYQYDPKPLTSKNSRRVVPDDEKTDQYWTRRNRNNKAARKSREFRRQKEMEVLYSMKTLEDENLRLRYFINGIVKNNQQLQTEIGRMRLLIAGNPNFFIPNQTIT